MDPPFWKGIMRVKDEFSKHGSFIIGDGQKARFWEDSWLGKTPLSIHYPYLYIIVRHINVKVADVLNQTSLNIKFMCVFRNGIWENWLNLVKSLMVIQLTDEPDSFSWHLTAFGIFSVKSLYAEYMNDYISYLKKYLWKLKVPLKFRIFMWFLHKKVLFTNDNLARRKWTGCRKFAIVSQKQMEFFMMLDPRGDFP
jgi:hypothetical protein